MLVLFCLFLFGHACPPHCHWDRCNATTGICEGCTAGWWGLQCTNDCPQHCHWRNDSGHGCNFTTGVCVAGCVPGYWGDFCNKDCPQHCHWRNDSGHGCDMKTGVCVAGCVPGYWGDYCDKDCPQNCKWRNDSGHGCNMKTGLCEAGCKYEWWGKTCDNPCSIHCHWRDSHGCNIDTGACNAGCNGGWTGPQCNIPPTGYDPRGDLYRCFEASTNFKQGRCNSCWAASSLSSFADRWCQKNSMTPIMFSVEQIVSCSLWKCGEVISTFDLYQKTLRNYVVDYGIVTQACEPYISGASGDILECKDGYYINKTCLSGSERTLYKGSSVYQVTGSTSSTTEDAIMNEIYDKGSVWSQMAFYNAAEMDKFINWNADLGGIWSCQDYTVIPGPGHIVKLIGWGVKEDKKYWIAWNPWGTDWTSKTGYFYVEKNADKGTCRMQVNTWAIGL